MTMAVTTVDLTPPEGGHVTAGPYYDMVRNSFLLLYCTICICR